MYPFITGAYRLAVLRLVGSLLEIVVLFALVPGMFLLCLNALSHGVSSTSADFGSASTSRTASFVRFFKSTQQVCYGNLHPP